MPAQFGFVRLAVLGARLGSHELRRNPVFADDGAGYPFPEGRQAPGFPLMPDSGVLG
jgi:hypothetical protein